MSCAHHGCLLNVQVSPADMKGKTTDKYAWVIVISSFLTLFFNSGVLYNVGVLHMRLVETYPQNEYAVAWLGSILTALSSLSGPVASLIINLYNCRTCAVLAGILGFIGFIGSYFVRSLSLLFVTYALLVGLGFGLSNTAAIVILGYYFQKDTSLATGITVTGHGLGMFVHPALTGFLLDTYGLRGTFLVLGAVVFQSCVCAMFMRPSKFEEASRVMSSSGHNKRQQIVRALCGGDCSQFFSIIKNIPFQLLVLSYFAVSMAIASVYLYLPDYFVQSGASQQIASFSISMSGIGSIICRILTGFAANDSQIGCLLLLAGITGISGIFVVFVNMFALTTTGQLTYGFLLGLYTGGTWVVCGPITLTLLCVENLATGFGLLMMMVGVAYLIGPPMAGLIFQASNQYYSVFLFCAAMFFTSSACSFITASFQNKDREEGATSYGRDENDAGATCIYTGVSQENCRDSDDKKTLEFVTELEILVSARTGDI